MWIAVLHSFNQCLSSSYSISAVPVISTAKTNLYDKTFMASVAHVVSLVLLIGQSLL